MRALRALINLVICSKKIKHGDEPVANQAVESRSRSGYQHHAPPERVWQEIHQLFFPDVPGIFRSCYSMKRRTFIKQATVVSTGTLLGGKVMANTAGSFPEVHTPASQRRFTSQAVEKAIASFKEKAGNKELAWLFENCFPNTLDTTVEFSMANGQPDTYIITGDIDAMWQRDSTAQVWPYLPFMKDDRPLQQLIAGTIRRQTKNIITDPYSNAFYKDPSKTGEWKNDRTEMKPGVHERKWEIDHPFQFFCCCYPEAPGRNATANPSR